MGRTQHSVCHTLHDKFIFAIVNILALWVRKNMLEKVNLVIDEEVGSVSLFFFFFAIILESKEWEVWVRMCLERSSPCSPSESWCTLLSDLGLFRKHQLIVIGAGKIHWICPSSPLTVTAIVTEAITVELLLLDWADRCWGLGPGSHIGQVWGSSQGILVQALKSTVAWIKFACEELGDLQRTWKPRVPIPRMNIKPGWVCGSTVRIERLWAWFKDPDPMSKMEEVLRMVPDVNQASTCIGTHIHVHTHVCLHTCKHAYTHAYHTHVKMEKKKKCTWRWLYW